MKNSCKETFDALDIDNRNRLFESLYICGARGTALETYETFKLTNAGIPLRTAWITPIADAIAEELDRKENRL